MGDPPRLLDDPNAPHEATDLLRALDAPTPIDASVRADIGARLAKSVLLPPVAVAKVVAFKAAVGAALVAGGATLYFAVRPAPEPAPLPPPTPAAVTNADAPAPPADPAPAPLADEAPAPEPEPERPADTKPSAPRAATRRDTLALEESLLEQARRAAAASPARALSLLHEHERRFPNGELTAERLYLTAQAHARAGNSTAARHYARLLADRFPRSTYVPRVEVLLKESKAAPPARSR